ncbi:hypothetical protein [Cellulomonas fimi]|uniref:Integral membrane protein n=1 Tax=Cellulomonas fimi TaxID=1708 RepID=A0A7Y0LZ90_CELFI|nr:hypothetical protein [Cellulomonas fimi]NMR20952.1 hypothetical protein [Cellulomonas fimi]
MRDDEGSAGLVPAPVPLAGLTEIRVHGVGGTTPETLLGDLSPTMVAGDRVAGFYRTSDAQGRHREAYSWGGLTSRSRSRALWALLLPSMFANMAGWMAQRWVTSGDVETREAPTTRPFRWAARLAALALTLSTAVMVTMVCLDTLAYQCGAQAACRRTGWWTGPLDVVAPLDRPGARLATGATVALAIALLFYVLANRTRSAYERVEPPTPISVDQGALDPEASTPTPSRRSAAAQVGGLRHPEFWSGALWHTHLSRLHLAACLAVVATMLGWPLVQLGSGALAAAAVVLGGLSLVAVLAALALDDAAPRLAIAVVLGALLALGLGLSAALVLPTAAATGALPGSREAVNVGWGLSLVLLVPLVVQQSVAWARRRALAESPAGRRRVDVFPWAGPFVMNTVAMLIANTVLLSVMVFVARALGRVEWGFGPGPGAVGTPGPATLWVPPAVGSLASVLSIGLITVTVVFAVVVGLWLRRAAGKDAVAVEADLRSRYAREGVPQIQSVVEPRTDAAWWRSAFDPPPFAPISARTSGHPSRWVRKVALMRRVGAHSRVVAWLFVVFTGFALVGLVLFLGYVWVLGRGAPMVLVELGTTVAVALPPLYVLVLTATWRNERYRRVLGSLFDVGTFFPRSFHPFAPPSYTERAVPELTRRIWRLHDNGGSVVLTAHSQGSVLAAAALGRESARPGDEPRVGLVTLGSPLAKLYRWAFPALFSDGFLAGLASGAAGIGRVRWRNVHYLTDYIGGPVRTEGSVIAGGIDVELVDPPTHRYVFDQPLPRVLSHTGYWSDRAFWRQVDEMCQAVRPGTAAPPASVDGLGTVHDGAGAVGDAGSQDAGSQDTVVADPRIPVRYR